MPSVAEHRETKADNRSKPLSRKPLVLRCMVFQEGSAEEYTAECVDLDIMARGRTPHEALQSLIQAVDGYISVAVKGDCTGLIPRPSPLSHRVRYHLFALRAAFNFGGLERNFLLSDWSPASLC